jgi:hypothetical protein
VRFVYRRSLCLRTYVNVCVCTYRFFCLHSVFANIYIFLLHSVFAKIYICRLVRFVLLQSVAVFIYVYVSVHICIHKCIVCRQCGLYLQSVAVFIYIYVSTYILCVVCGVFLAATPGGC